MNRRGFLRGLVSALAAPAVVRAELLMPISALHVPTDLEVATYGVVPRHWIDWELAAATKRAFIPRIVAQIYRETWQMRLLREATGTPIYMYQPVNKLVDN